MRFISLSFVSDANQFLGQLLDVGFGLSSIVVRVDVTCRHGDDVVRQHPFLELQLRHQLILPFAAPGLGTAKTKIVGVEGHEPL